jgi:ribonuclease HI
LGLGSTAFLSSGLLNYLRDIKVFFLFQAQHNSDCGLSCTNWKSSSDLGLTGELALEWKSYCSTLLGVGIRLNLVEDSLHWTGSDRSGHLTVKNVYNVISSTIWIQKCTGWRQNLWHWSLLLKIKFFILLAANDKILTWDILLPRGWEGPNMCILYRINYESIPHIFIDCTFTKLVWNKLTLVLNLPNMWTGSTLHDCLENWASTYFTLPHLPDLVCWFIWLTRNRELFENTSVSLNFVCFRILGELKIEKKKRTSAPRFIQPILHMIGNNAWFDNTSQNSGLQCGVGGCILLSDGTKITWTFNYGAGSNTKAELLGVWATLLLASRHNILDLDVRGESKIIIDWLIKKGHIKVISLECWKDRIIELVQAFSRIIFSHIYRELNVEANYLSKSALSKQIGILAYQHWTDGLGSPPQCINIF